MHKIGLFLCAMVLALGARAELTIEITQGVDNPTPIAVVPFGGAQNVQEDLTQIISADLMRSGLFHAIPQRDMLSFPKKESEIYYRDWRVLGANYLVVGDLQKSPTGFVLEYQLYDVIAQRRVLSRTVTGSDTQVRDIAHLVSDEVYQSITGIKGAFSTKILYVEDLGKSVQKRYRIVLADADGARDKVLFSSSEPLLSPTWSNDMRYVAYVSFETSRPAIFRQNIRTGEREQLTNFRGLNGAPAFSPDDTKLAMVLSKDGNPEIYTLEIATKKLRRVTQTSSSVIDTEPNWTEDGKGIIFTSNRGGNPQIYQIHLASGRTERLTFEGDYNARPRVSPDGKSLVMVHRENGIFHIAWQDIASGDMRILTETWLDESPSIAPNGAMLLYATQHNNKGVLAAVSLDAGVKYRLPSKRGDVREPAWSPFIK
ncbi:Tol-Pal system beta propeller repeat protein TolB [Teredinibacter sp. KSP-S5-2]|uniref:Tol-Pal system beta propeller repeat protein TolB n=1 Tax=Teredinibacter sp. KSP-S5-2 TaxID=3034506 RepID=UPI0029341A69|nr:Tol-Pal system beta propeller repeat protein TolB [Teredinibacter sp. KSP-S5-2]WNO08110.1 Tol-Pal system beta propeller repeat protein TolB [Teredinibacter sp. KSP-S5-2]